MTHRNVLTGLGWALIGLWLWTYRTHPCLLADPREEWAMSTIYVSGPMTGLPEFNYPAFHAAADRLREAGYSVLNPADNVTDQPQTWEWYLRRDVKMLADSDGVATLPGWESSRGAQLEVHIAATLGMVAQPLDDWLAAKVATS